MNCGISWGGGTLCCGSMWQPAQEKLRGDEGVLNLQFTFSAYSAVAPPPMSISIHFLPFSHCFLETNFLGMIQIKNWNPQKTVTWFCTFLGLFHIYLFHSAIFFPFTWKHHQIHMNLSEFDNLPHVLLHF